MAVGGGNSVEVINTYYSRISKGNARKEIGNNSNGGDCIWNVTISKDDCICNIAIGTGL